MALHETLQQCIYVVPWAILELMQYSSSGNRSSAFPVVEIGGDSGGLSIEFVQTPEIMPWILSRDATEWRKDDMSKRAEWK